MKTNTQPKIRKEMFEHDVCPKCKTVSVPLESVPDQALRGCPKCCHIWFENLAEAVNH